MLPEPPSSGSGASVWATDQPVATTAPSVASAASPRRRPRRRALHTGAQPARTPAMTVTTSRGMSSWWWKGSRALRRSLRGFHGVPNVPWLDRRTSHGNSPTNHPRDGEQRHRPQARTDATPVVLSCRRRPWRLCRRRHRRASLSWAAGSSGTRSSCHRVSRSPSPALEAQGVADDEHRRQRHGRTGDHRVEKAEPPRAGWPPCCSRTPRRGSA